MRIRKTLIAAVASLALALPLGAIATSETAEAAGPSILPFNIVNNSGRGEQVFMYVIGVDLKSDRLGYVNQAGVFHAWPAGSNPPVPAPDVSIATPASGGRSTINVPIEFSGRIYMAFGEKLKFALTPDGLVQPAPWAGGEANRNILFDWSEFTYNAGGLYLNSSQVDMFAVPHAVSVTSGDGKTIQRGELLNNGRNKVIDGIRNQPGWANTIVTRGDGTVLRVLSPGKAADSGSFDKNYLDPYINEAWNAYTSKTLTVQPFGDRPEVKYFGKTSGNTMNFTDTSGRQVASFQKPSTSNVWGCDGNLHAPNDLVVGPIARTLCAALHRSTLGRLDTQPSGTAADFYKGNITNHYSRIIHQNMVDGRAYGFAFDDVQAQESLVHSGDPKSAGITLTPFGAGGPTTPTTPTDPGTPSNPPAPPATSGKAITSQLSGKCIDVPNWKFNDGQRLIVWNCTKGTNQQWEFKDGTIRTQNNMCMDVAGASTANGTAIQLARCSGNKAQQFVLSGAGDLVSVLANKCVDIKDMSRANDALLQIWECSGNANQKWTRS